MAEAKEIHVPVKAQVELEPIPGLQGMIQEMVEKSSLEGQLKGLHQAWHLVASLKAQAHASAARCQNGGAGGLDGRGARDQLAKQFEAQAEAHATTEQWIIDNLRILDPDREYEPRAL